MHLGTAEAAPGELARGWLDVTDLPTGGAERLPVLIANGVDDGPTLWLTGGVHGDEATGVAVAQDAMREDLPELLAGAIVCVPVVSPAGLRRNARHTYYGDDDPNRHFPDVERSASRPPEVQERIDRRLYEAIAGEPAPDADEGGDEEKEDGADDNEENGTDADEKDGPGSRDDLAVDASPDVAADALIDLHTAGVGSVPFAIRDRVLYGERRSEDEAEALADDLDRLADAFGFPVLTEYPAEEYLDQRLQRSTAGAALNTGGVPAITVELGAHSVVEEDTRAAGVAGVYAAAEAFDLLDAADVPTDLPAPGEGVPDAPVEFPVRRFRGPRTETAGLLRHRVAAGEAVEAGDTLADVVAPTGEPRGEVTVDRDGYVLGRAEGLAAYEGDAVASLAVRDDGDLVVPRDANED